MYRQGVPHWRRKGCTYFVTFILWDALPRKVLGEFGVYAERWMKAHPTPWTEAVYREYRRRIVSRIHKWLDAGHGQCLLADGQNATILERAMHHFDGEHFYLDAYVIMPNHAHMLVKPRQDMDLEELLFTWKTVSSRLMNRPSIRRGSVWLENHLDHVVKTKSCLDRYRKYIELNPVRAGLDKGAFIQRRGKGITA